MKKIIIILQSRYNSNRLPGKALKKINQIPIVVICAKRLANRNHDVIVATSNKKSDDILVKTLKKNKINFFRGKLNNVFSRYLAIAKKYKMADYIVRATGDNIFPDGYLVDLLHKEIKNRNLDYLGIDFKKNLLPYGLSLEIFTVKKILETSKLNLNKDDLEHVTLKMYKNKNKYKNIIINKLKQNKNLSKLRITIDTNSDYIFMKKILKDVKNITKVPYFKLLKLLENKFL